MDLKNTVKTYKSYIKKREKFIKKPAIKVKELLKTGREQEGYGLLDYWLASDIYPDYISEQKKIFDFLELTSKFKLKKL